MNSELMTVKELARSRGVSLKAVYDQLAVGRLKGARKIGKIWYIPRTDYTRARSKKNRSVDTERRGVALDLTEVGA